MNTARPCGCKGIRSCLICEHSHRIQRPSYYKNMKFMDPWSYCPMCDVLYEGWDAYEIYRQHPHHDSQKRLHFPGIYLKEQFLSHSEGIDVVSDLDSIPWSLSQSGRRKQNFGPSVNFKHRKLKRGSFRGFPACTRFIQERFETLELLKNFNTIEQCSLEYEERKGASIDPHIDDCWIWGERVVTVNCQGDAILTLTLYEPSTLSSTKYNLDIVPSYEHELMIPLMKQNIAESYKRKIVRIPMPSLSVIILYGPARYQFEHSILREDISGRRVCIAYRELTPPHKTNVNTMPIVEAAKCFLETL